MSHDKPRLPRIERSEDLHIDDETAHLWAISYADFLMVLLSFFILFFSTDTDDRNILIKQILTATDETSSHLSSDGSAPSGKTLAPQEVMSAISSDDIKEALYGFQIRLEAQSKQIEFLFPDNIYAVGGYDLKTETKEQLAALLSRLKPFESQIEVIFVGHTDSAPLVRGPAAVLNDNFALSVIRASRALQFAVQEGIKPEGLSAKGSADAQRSSRTLTLIVKPKVL